MIIKILGLNLTSMILIIIDDTIIQRVDFYLPVSFFLPQSFSGLHNLYFKNGDGFIFVYSVTSSSSLEDLPPLAEQMRRVKDK